MLQLTFQNQKVSTGWLSLLLQWHLWSRQTSWLRWKQPIWGCLDQLVIPLYERSDSVGYWHKSISHIHLAERETPKRNVNKTWGISDCQTWENSRLCPKLERPSWLGIPVCANSIELLRSDWTDSDTARERKNIEKIKTQWKYKTTSGQWVNNKS